jgi:hypothetical protein
MRSGARKILSFYAIWILFNSKTFHVSTIKWFDFLYHWLIAISGSFYWMVSLFNAHSKWIRPTGIFKFDYWPILCVIHVLCMAHPFCATDQRCPLEIAARWYHLVWGAAHKLPGARWVWSAESPFSQTFALVYILWLLTIPTRNSLFRQCILYNYIYIIWLQGYLCVIFWSSFHHLKLIIFS